MWWGCFVIRVYVELTALLERTTPTTNFFFQRGKWLFVSTGRAIQKTSDAVLIDLKFWDVLKPREKVKDACK
jgi:hypothetical protein